MHQYFIFGGKKQEVDITKASMIFKLFSEHVDEMEMNSQGFLWFGGRGFVGEESSRFGP